MEIARFLKILKPIKKLWKMFKIKISKQYKKNYKKLSLQDQELVDSVVYKLSQNQALEKKYRDHKLQGRFQDYRECHIKPDLLLIYQKQEDVLILTCVNIGSHSQLF